MTLEELSAEAMKRLAGSVDKGEAKAMVRVMFEHFKGYTPVDMVIRGGDEITLWLRTTIEKAVDRVVAGEPLQYVLGVARFMGNDYKVTPAVLIPRPETQGLVDMVTDFCGDRADLKILDACTGSGCIAIALARALKFAKIDAFDISDDVLEVARENARNLKVKVTFFRQDALHLAAPPEPIYNVIVSNPPYVHPSEAASMDPRVLNHEPSSALFVPADNPLVFYRALAQYARRALLPGGRLFFEINPLEADNLAVLLKSEGFSVEFQRDYVGKVRFAVCQIDN